MELSTESHWSSTLSEAASIPWKWFSFVSPTDLILKNSKENSTYCNTLESPLRFAYMLPSKGAEDLCLEIERQSKLDLEEKTLIVKLYTTANARNHYCGEWCVLEYSERRNKLHRHPHVILGRLKHQRGEREFSGGVLAKVASPMRSQSELNHSKLLEETFAPKYKIMHEPCCTQNLYVPAFVDGHESEFGGTQYTVDFVLTNPSRCKSIWIESKHEDSALDLKAKEKCRALRDSIGARVVALTGHGNELRVYDFSTATSTETVMDWKSFTSLALQFGDEGTCLADPEEENPVLKLRDIANPDDEERDGCETIQCVDKIVQETVQFMEIEKYKTLIRVKDAKLKAALKKVEDISESYKEKFEKWCSEIREEVKNDATPILRRSKRKRSCT